MKKLVIYLIILLNLVSEGVKSQNDECKKSFVSTIGATGIDEANQFIGYQDGFLVSGTTNSKFVLMFLSENGKINWTYELDIFQNLTERATNMTLDGENLVVVGNSELSNGVIQNFILKFNIQSKNIIWLKIRNNLEFSTSYFTSVLNETTTDTYYVLGQTQENFSPGLGCDALLLKVNKITGNVELAKNVNLGSCETYTSSLIANNGFIYGAGRFNSAGGGQDKFRGSLTKLDLDGNEIWSKLYTKDIISDEARLYFQTIAEDNGNLILGGQGDLDGTSTSDVDVLLMKTNLDGEIVWHKEVNILNVNSEYSTKVIVMNSAYYLLVNATSSGNNDFVILKFDSEGNLVWNKMYGRQSNDRGNDILVTENNIFIVGKTNSFGGTGDDILIAKTDLEGNGLNESCNFLKPINANSKNSISPFEGEVNTLDYNIDFPLTDKSISVRQLNLTANEICSVTCADTCKNGVIVHTVPDAKISDISVQCKGGKSYELTIKICNLDSVTLSKLTPFVIYDNNPTINSAQIIFQSNLGIDVLTNKCETIKFTTSLLEAHNYFVVVNDNGSLVTPFSLNDDFPSTNIQECDFQNNLLGFATGVADTTYISETLVLGESIQIGQETYDTKGQYVQNLSNIYGCDSTLVITINIINADILYDFNNCAAVVGSSNMDYSEFLPSKASSIECGIINSSNIYRRNPLQNKHSCTPGLDNSNGMCVESKLNCVYNPGDERSVIFTMEVIPNIDKHIQIHEIRFFEKSPLNYDWVNGDKGLNNYPTKFGLRVLKNNIEILRITDINSLRDWNERKFNFDNLPAFVSKEKSTFQFEFLAYCPIGNNSTVSVWDIENMSIFTSCVEKESRILSGGINNFDGKPFSDITVYKQQNIEIEHQKTDANGKFKFENFEIVDGCEISVIKNDDYLNGISTLDLILIQRHILGLDIFDDSRKYIAADINNDAKVSASDLVELRRLILGITEKFNNNGSWRFCTEIPLFNLNSKIEVNEKYQVSNGQNDIINLNFTGIKVGDINDDNNVKDIGTSRDRKVELFEYTFEKISQQESYINIYSNGSNELNGFQISLEINDLKFLDIINSQISLSSDDIYVNNDKIFISFSSPTSVKFDITKPIFSLLINSANILSNNISMNNNFKNEFYSVDLQTKKVELREKIVSNIIEFVNAKPNPFDNVSFLEFYTSDISPVEIEIYSLTGNLVFSKILTPTLGTNQVEISSNQLGNLTGMYIIKVCSRNESHALKLILK